MDGAEEEDCNCVEGAPAWMATMGDLMSLLLTFFVLLLTFANMDKQLFMEALGSIHEALGIKRDDPGFYQARSSSAVELSDRESTPFLDIMNLPTTVKAPTMDQKVMQQVSQFVAENGLERIIEVESTERGVVVRVSGEVVFTPGSDELLPSSFVFLDEIVRLSEEFPYELSIEGHTDDVPVRSARFPTNWHLSSARAISVLRYLVETGGIPASRLMAAGFADTRPLVANEGEANRARNRRVEFVYLRDPSQTRVSRAEAKARRARVEAGIEPAPTR